MVYQIMISTDVKFVENGFGQIGVMFTNGFCRAPSGVSNPGRPDREIQWTTYNSHGPDKISRWLPKSKMTTIFLLKNDDFCQLRYIGFKSSYHRSMILMSIPMGLKF